MLPVASLPPSSISPPRMRSVSPQSTKSGDHSSPSHPTSPVDRRLRTCLSPATHGPRRS